jgi:hypothetical protein
MSVQLYKEFPSAKKEKNRKVLRFDKIRQSRSVGENSREREVRCGRGMFYSIADVYWEFDVFICLFFLFSQPKIITVWFFTEKIL